VDIPITFPTGEVTPTTLYVTTLDSSCSVVLGYNWLTRYNPLIDWVLGSITFCNPESRNSQPAQVSTQPTSTSASTIDPPILNPVSVIIPDSEPTLSAPRTPTPPESPSTQTPGNPKPSEPTDQSTSGNPKPSEQPVPPIPTYQGRVNAFG